MNKIKSARQILEALKDSNTLICLKDLAKKAGFQGANRKNFKRGLNYLVQRKIIKIHQGGWPSELRGGKNHPKGVILLGNIFELIEDFSFLEETDKSKLKKPRNFAPFTGEDIFDIPRDEQFDKYLKKISKCRQCKSNPQVFVTLKKIPLCKKHWARLANKDINW